MTDAHNNNETGYVFVYGSLKHGYGNHSVLGASSFISTATLDGYSMISLGAYPGIIPGDDTDTVRGEVYLVTDQDTMADLDCLEGHPDFYERVRRVVTLHNGIRVSAWVYVLPEDEYSVYPSVSGGEW